MIGTKVTYDDDPSPTTHLVSTDYRSNFIVLAYKQLLGAARVATAAEITAGKALIARPLSIAVGAIQGSEWLYWKLLSSQEYFNTKTQAESAGVPDFTKDNGLHTDRSWVDGAIADRAYRASSVTERSLYSQKILDQFKIQRAAFAKALINSPEYRAVKITEYFQLVLARNPTNTTSTSELPVWLAKMKAGITLTTLVSTLLGTWNNNEYFKNHTTLPPIDDNNEWARAVYTTLLSRAATLTEENALATRAKTSGRTVASLSVINSIDKTNGETFRDKLIRLAFGDPSLGQPGLLSRAPTAAELLAYENFLKTNRWENMLVDIMANGLAIVEDPTLPREFWEIAD